MCTKTCSTCKVEKPVEEFSMKNKATGLRQSKCKPCTNAYGKGHYSENKSTYVKKAAVNREKVSAQNKAYVQKSLEGKACKHCGSTHDLLYYQGLGAKTQPVHMAVHAGLAVARVQEAIDRSEVTCRKCLNAGIAKTGDFAEWGRKSHPERLASQASRTELPDYKKNPGKYKGYRPLSAASALANSAGTSAQGAPA